MNQLISLALAGIFSSSYTRLPHRRFAALFYSMMDTGRIQAVVISTAAGNVIYERFYERFSEQDKALLRATLSETAEASLTQAPEQQEYATRYRDGAVVLRREGDLNYFALGDGEYDELNLSEVLKAVALALRDALKKAPSEALLFDNYGRLCLVLDSMIYEGILDRVEPDAIQRAL